MPTPNTPNSCPSNGNNATSPAARRGRRDFEDGHLSVHSITFELNGKKVTHSVGPEKLLADVLRDELGLTGTKIGCSIGVCGACSVHVDGKLVFGEYKRFAFTDDGVSPRVIPGVEGGMHLAAGSEHNDAGVITEGARNRERMMDKRMHKMVAMRADLPKANLFGDPSAKIAMVGYGSNRGPIAEALDRLAAAGVPTRFLQLKTLWPFPEDDIRSFFAGADHIFIVENNYTGQLERLIRYVVGPLEHMHSVRKYNGRPFRPIEIIQEIERSAAAGTMAQV